MKTGLGKMLAVIFTAGVAFTTVSTVVTPLTIVAAEETKEWSDEDLQVMFFSQAIKEGVYGRWIWLVDYSKCGTAKSFVEDLNEAKKNGATDEQIALVIDKWLAVNKRTNLIANSKKSDACYMGSYTKLIYAWLQVNRIDKICWGHLNDVGTLKIWVDIIGPTNVPYEQAKLCGYEQEWIAAHKDIKAMTSGDALCMGKAQEWADSHKLYEMNQYDAQTVGKLDEWNTFIQRHNVLCFYSLYDAEVDNIVDEWLTVMEGDIVKTSYRSLYRGLCADRYYNSQLKEYEYKNPSKENLIKLLEIWAANTSDIQVNRVLPDAILPENTTLVDRWIKLNGYEKLNWDAACNLNLKSEYITVKGVANVPYVQALEAGFEKEWIAVHTNVASMTSGDALLLGKTDEYSSVKEVTVNDVVSVVEAADASTKVVKVDAKYDGSAVFDKELFNKASEKNVELVIEKPNVTWTFPDLSQINQEAFADTDYSGNVITPNIFNTTVYIQKPTVNNPFDESDNSPVIEIVFMHEGKLPAPAEVKIATGDKFMDGSNVYFYYIKDNGNGEKEYEKLGQVKVTNGQVSINIEHCSSYLLSEKAVSGDMPADYTGWIKEEDVDFWYELGVKQGVKLNEDGTIDLSYRGKEIFDPESNAWYWLDNVEGGKKATSKDVYQESLAGTWGDRTNDAGEKIGKWVRYDADGHMIKGWCVGVGADAKAVADLAAAGDSQDIYYFDIQFGTMAKGYCMIDGVEYFFDEATGVYDRTVTDSIEGYNGWKTVEGAQIWYENGLRQGYSVDKSYRGKEIYDAGSDAWYWLDNVSGGAKATSKDVYQESLAGDWGDKTNDAGEKIGKWVRYDAEGHMIKGWSEKDGFTYYFDMQYGTMAKGEVTIDGEQFTFDVNTGIRQ